MYTKHDSRSGDQKCSAIFGTTKPLGVDAHSATNGSSARVAVRSRDGVEPYNGSAKVVEQRTGLAGSGL